MQKIFISIIFSLILSSAGGEFIKKEFKEKWFLSIAYEHIGRTLDTRYMLLSSSITGKTEQNYGYFVSNLTNEIVSKRTLNACTAVRGDQDNPNILIKFIQLNLEISMVASNKQMLLECEKFVDKKVDEFNSLNREILNIFTTKKNNPLINSDVSLENQKSILIDVFREFEKGGLEAFIENQSDAESKLKYATLMLGLLQGLDQKRDDMSDVFSDMIFVKKSHRDIKIKEESKIVMYLGLFIIIQTLMLILIYIDKKNILFLLSKTKKIFKF